MADVAVPGAAGVDGAERASDESVSRNPEWVATPLFFWRVLRPLWWFGLVGCRERGEGLDDGSWRKGALFDQFLNFGTDLVRTVGPVH